MCVYCLVCFNCAVSSPLPRQNMAGTVDVWACNSLRGTPQSSRSQTSQSGQSILLPSSLRVRLMEATIFLEVMGCFILLQSGTSQSVPIMLDFDNSMAVINIGLLDMGAQVIEETSAAQDHSGQNVLCEQMLWTSQTGLPQSIVIDLRGVEVEYSSIVEIGFKCWHDYPSNPRSIELEVARDLKHPTQYWQGFNLQKSSEPQFFPIKMHSSFRILRFTISQTFGEEETYLNQIFIHAQTSQSPLHEDELAVEDLHSPMKITFPKPKPSPRPYLPPEPSSEPQLLPYETRGQYMAGSDEEEQPEEEEQVSPLKNDIYILTENVAQMEDNLQEIKRSVQVLDLKVQVASQSIEKNLTKKLKSMVKQQMEQFKQEIRTQLSLQGGKLDLREVRSQKSRRSMRSKQGLEQGGGSRQSSHRKQKQSLHLHNLNQDKLSQSRRNNDAYMSKLLSQLSKKLKQREVKVRKIEAKQAHEHRHATHQQ